MKKVYCDHYQEWCQDGTELECKLCIELDVPQELEIVSKDEWKSVKRIGWGILALFVMAMINFIVIYYVQTF